MQEETILEHKINVKTNGEIHQNPKYKVNIYKKNEIFCYLLYKLPGIKLVSWVQKEEWDNSNEEPTSPKNFLFGCRKVLNQNLHSVNTAYNLDFLV